MSNWQATGCFRYHKGTDFQANHNRSFTWFYYWYVVLDTTKVLIFKQITTKAIEVVIVLLLF